MKSDQYLWRIVFDDDSSFKKVAEFLGRTGEFEGNDFTAFRCPDKIYRSGIMVRFEVINQARSLKVGKRGAIDFKVIRSKGSFGKPEFWSEPTLSSDGPKKRTVAKRAVKIPPPDIMTGTVFAQMQEKARAARTTSFQNQEDGGLHFLD